MVLELQVKQESSAEEPSVEGRREVEVLHRQQIELPEGLRSPSQEGKIFEESLSLSESPMR